MHGLYSNFVHTKILYWMEYSTTQKHLSKRYHILLEQKKNILTTFFFAIFI